MIMYLKKIESKKTFFILIVSIAVILTVFSTNICFASSTFSLANSSSSNSLSQIELIFNLPHHTEFQGGFGPVICGTYHLIANKFYTITTVWQEGGTRTIEVIEQVSSGDFSSSEHIIESGEPMLFRVDKDGTYMIKIKDSSSMNDIIYILQVTPM